MRKFILYAGAAFLTVLVSGSAFAGNGNNGAKVGKGGFMLNVVAYDICPAGDFTGSNRHHIAVEADYSLDQNGNLAGSIVRTNTIKLTSSGVGGDIQVLDGNACANRGKDGAELLLPIDVDNCAGDCPVEDPTFTQYRVYVRLVGQPGSGINVTTCAEETDDTIFDDNDGGTGDLNILCSTESVVEVRETGGNKTRFTDYSKELLTICLDTADDGNFDGRCDERVALFDPRLIEYFWQWNTNGRAHAQLVFKPVS